MGVSVSGTIFTKSYAFNAEVLRETGEVFEGETYLFQRGLVDAVKTFDLNPGHKIAFGVAGGQTSGSTFSIKASTVTSQMVTGFSYGPVLRNYLSLSQEWEMQGKLFYLLGDIKQTEIGADAIRHFKGFLFLGGVSYSLREYEESSGKQSSLRLSFGFGKEF
jgi:hypothetical protein